MNLPFLSIFSKKNNKALKLPNSILINKLKIVAQENNLDIFQNAIIYNNTQNFLIPLIIIDNNQSILLFEHKDWSFDDLKDSKIEKAINQKTSKETIAFEKTHQFIKRKFNELTHDDVIIHNYLLMENLNVEQYKHLDNSFLELLPEEKIIFSNSTNTEIIDKIKNNEISKKPLLNLTHIMSTLLIQYAIINNNKNIYLASQEQINFIESPLKKISTLNATYGNGKTSSILSKVILEKLKNQELNITIVKPTLLACDILRKKLLDIVKHAISEINIIDIEIITPNDFMDKSFKKADLIICDDAELYSDSFINYLHSIKGSLIIVKNSLDTKSDFIFTKKFIQTQPNIIFHKTVPHAKALHLVSSLLVKNTPNDILVISNKINRKKLKDDLEFFIEAKTIFLDGFKNLTEQNLATLRLATYKDINSIEAKYVILLDTELQNIDELNYAYNIAKNSVYILYEKESDDLNQIKSNFKYKE